MIIFKTRNLAGILCFLAIALVLYFGMRLPDFNRDMRPADTDDAAAQTGTDSKIMEIVEERETKITRELETGLYPTSLSGPYTLSRNPLEVYLENVGQAEEGDPKALYWVSKAFGECSRAPRTETEFLTVLEQIYAQGGPVSMEGDLRHLMSRCKGLFELAEGIESFAQEAARLLRRAADAGYRTASVEIILNSISGMDPVTADLINQAVESEGYAAWYAASDYLSRRSIETESVERSLILQRAAWKHAACTVHEVCNVLALEEQLQYRYPSWEIDEITNMSNQIISGHFPIVP